MVMGRRGENDLGFTDTYRVDVPITALASGGTPPTAVTRAPFRLYAYTIADDSYFESPVPADWAAPNGTAAATAIAVHVRWVCNLNYTNESVQWRVVYENVDQNNQTIGAGTGATVNSGNINIPVTALQIQETDIGDIIAGNLAGVDTIGVTLSRQAAGVAPASEPEILAVWLEYTRFVSVYA